MSAAASTPTATAPPDGLLQRLSPASTSWPGPRPPPRNRSRYREPKKALGIERLAEHGAQGRGVMIDLEHLRPPPAGVGYAHCGCWMRMASPSSRRHGSCTGFTDTLAMNRQPDVERLHQTGSGRTAGTASRSTDCRCQAGLPDRRQPGRRTGGAEAADTDAVRQPRLPLHEHCLFRTASTSASLVPDRAGHLHARTVARASCDAPPLRLPGAVGSPAADRHRLDTAPICKETVR